MGQVNRANTGASACRILSSRKAPAAAFGAALASSAFGVAFDRFPLQAELPVLAAQIFSSDVAAMAPSDTAVTT